MRLDRWKEEIIEGCMEVFLNIVDNHLDLLRARNFDGLRVLAESKYFETSRVEDEYKSKEPRLVKLTYNYLNEELERTNWYCFDDAYYATLKHYGIKTE